MRDRLSFWRFCGIPLDQETPDHSSIWRFRQRIEKLGLSEKLLAEVNRQLDARGLIVKRGTLVDATIIAAAVKPPSFGEGVVSERDPDASFTVKNDETSFGYKAGDEAAYYDADVQNPRPQCPLHVDFVEKPRLQATAICVSGGCQRGKAGHLRLTWRRPAPERG